MMGSSILWVLFLTVFPLILIKLASIFSLLDKIGVVVLAFVSGLIVSVVYQPQDLVIAQHLSQLKMQFAEVCIGFAIPLLLFSINIVASFKLAKRTLTAMLLACFSVGMASFFAMQLIYLDSKHMAQAAGMVVGAYTGGGQNIGAVKVAINADNNLFVDILTYDIVISSLFLLFAITLLKPFFKPFLPIFNSTQQTHNLSNQYDNEGLQHFTSDSAHSFLKIFQLKHLPQVCTVLLCAIGCIGFSILIAKLAPQSMQSAITIIGLSVTGALLSLIPKIRQLTISYRLGMLFIIMFCFASGSMATSAILSHLNLNLFMYMGSIVILATLLHALLCRVFSVDIDTFVVTITAAVMSVPFIPMVITRINNKALLFPGIAAAVVGYVIGNYMGIAVYAIIKSGFLI